MLTVTWELTLFIYEYGGWLVGERTDNLKSFTRGLYVGVGSHNAEHANFE